MKTPKRVAALAALILLTTAPLTVPRLKGQAPQQPPLKYEVSVTLKLIQVYVTDKSGKPVRDLTQEEFRLTDNGKPVTISAFEKHDLAAAPTAGVEAPVPEPTPEPAAPALSRKFVIFFDLAFNTGHGVKASIEAARRFVETTASPGDELALVSFSMLDGFKIHEFLTTDHAKVKAALSTISAKNIAGRADEVEQAYWLAVDNPSLAPRGATNQKVGGLSQLDMDRLDSMQQAGRYFRALTQFAQSLRLVQGQKNIIFFSTGIPSSMVNASRGVGGTVYSGGGAGIRNDGMGGAAPQRGSTFQVGNYELRPLQEAMLKEFSASNCSLYSFDTRESSKIPSLFDVDQMATASGGNPLLGSNSLFRSDETTGMDSLKKMSQETGGKYYSNITLHEKNLDEVSAVTGAYYVLGYSVSTAADGEFHKIGIAVSRPGCEVRTQPGYFDPKPFREFTDLEKNIQLFDLALNEKSEFEAPKPLPVTALAYDAGRGARVRVIARVPEGLWGHLGGKTAEIVALFFDAKDDLMSLQRVAVDGADYAGKDLLFSAGTAAQPGAVKCRVVVRDLDTGRSAVASSSIYCGALNRQTLSISSPLLLVAGGGLRRIDGVVKGAAEDPPWREIYPYDPAGFSPVVGSDPVSAGRVTMVLPYAAPGLGAADLNFRANLVDASTGRNVAVPLELRESTKAGAVEVQKLAIGLEGVPDGSYILFVHVGNRLTGQVASARTALTVAH